MCVLCVRVCTVQHLAGNEECVCVIMCVCVDGRVYMRVCVRVCFVQDLVGNEE